MRPRGPRPRMAVLGASALLAMALASAGPAAAFAAGPAEPSPSVTPTPSPSPTSSPTPTPTPTATAPGPVTGLAWVVSGTSGARLSWTAPASAAAGLTYTVAVTDAPGGSQTITTTATSVLLTSLQPGTVVRASVSDGSDPVEAPVWHQPAVLPGVPTHVRLVGVDERGVPALEVTWRPPASDGGSAITAYTVRIRQSGSSVAAADQVVAAGLRRVVFTDVTANAGYLATVSATTAAGTGVEAPSSTVDVAVPGAVPAAVPVPTPAAPASAAASSVAGAPAPSASPAASTLADGPAAQVDAPSAASNSAGGVYAILAATAGTASILLFGIGVLLLVRRRLDTAHRAD